MFEVLQRPLVATICIAAGCASPVGGPVRSEGTGRVQSATGVASAMAVESKSDAVVIGELRLRDAELVISASGGAREGLKFDVRDRQGNVLHEALTEADLDALFPELHQAYRNSLATGLPALDARVDPKYLTPSGAVHEPAPGK